MIPKKERVQSSITSIGFPLLQKPVEMCDRSVRSECLGNSGTLTKSLQEMGVEGQDNTEPAGSNDDNIYFFSCVVDLMIRKITR